MIYDVVVIGAGQAGLAMGYYLKQSKLSFLILDKGSEIGESWDKQVRLFNFVYPTYLQFTSRIIIKR